MDLNDAQMMMLKIYGERDFSRGVHGTFLWLIEEIGELANALRRNNAESIQNEFADVLAWLFSLANVIGINLNQAFLSKYNHKCPKCGLSACACKEIR